ncbi:DNA topoisomerase I [archaeon]|jgi:DNA topoisomerase I|nr:DNA topoisomerase I [archaeon]MBT4417531.1 DNA topoisomerase I [archaeon]
MTALIIAEKPSACKKIAEALADKTVVKSTYMRKIPYYEIEHKGKKVIVVCAVGHLYGVAEKNKKGWTYPVFNIEWKPSFEVSKGSAYTKLYLNCIKKCAKGAKEIILATDYDVEGETIGWNIVRFGLGKKSAARMKFSTTTKEDLLGAYENQKKSLDLRMAESGITRHELDFFWGINLSRALTLALKSAMGGFRVLSSGRVQGPALKILAEREKEIAKFKPVPYWELELICKELSAWHKEGKFWDKKNVDLIVKKCKGKDAKISKVTRKRFKHDAPHPFDLTSLQVEAYRLFRIQPKETLSIAQELYSNSYISYPRTSSNQLSDKIGYSKILKAMSKQDFYRDLCKDLLKKKTLKPNNGKKKDAAHPAIYCTGEVPKKLEERERKIYDLIVKRFMATFAEPAVRESMTVTVDCGGENFLAKGVRTVEEGWYKYYRPYVKVEEQEFIVKEGQELNVKELKLHSKETQPPKRYTPASIIKELEKRGLGTKATRSEIIEHLFDRGYLKRNGSIAATGLGIKTVEILEKFVPEILDEKLTRRFENDMVNIQEGKKKEKDVLDDAEAFLGKLLKKFKANEKEIGEFLKDAFVKTRDEESFVMDCPECKGKLQIRYTPRFKSYFIACSSYPDCKKSFSLPRGFLARRSDKVCDACGFPEVVLIRKGSRPWQFCVNPECQKKKEWKAKQQKE